MGGLFASQGSLAQTALDMNSCKQAQLQSNQSLWASIGSASGHIDGPLDRTRANLKFEFRSSRLIA
jgi:hypothetical protein